MKKFRCLSFIIATSLLFAGCNVGNRATDLDKSEDKEGAAGVGTKIDEENNTSNNGTDENGTDTTNDGTTTNYSMSDFFLHDGAKAHYAGLGNEYAEMDIKVARPSNDFVVVHESNGGTVTRKSYKIEKGRILLLDVTNEEYDYEIPTISELNAMQAKEIYLQLPFSVGATFEDWTVVEVGAKLDTPYKNFDNAIVLEKRENDAIVRNYFVPGIGLARMEFKTNQGAGQEVVSSTIESVE